MQILSNVDQQKSREQWEIMRAETVNIVNTQIKKQFNDIRKFMPFSWDGEIQKKEAPKMKPEDWQKLESKLSKLFKN